MPSFEENPSGSYSNQSFNNTPSQSEVIRILRNGGEDEFRSLLPLLIAKSKQIGAGCDAVEKRDILIGLLSHAVCMRSGLGEPISRSDSYNINFKLLGDFDFNHFLEDLVEARVSLVGSLSSEDNLMLTHDNSSPALSRLINYKESSPEFLAYSLAALTIESSNEANRSIARRVLGAMSASRSRELFGVVSTNSITSFSSVALLGKIAYPNLYKSLGRLIADDIRQELTKYSEARVDSPLDMVHEKFFKSLQERVLFLRADYARSLRKWGNLVVDLKVEESSHREFSYPKGFLEYVFYQRGERHLIQPALAALVRDYHSRAIGRTAFATLKVLCFESEQQARNLVSMDWQSIYGHAQLDYDFDMH